MGYSDISFWLPWLNRLGIVFNLLAGFMLAPELIGLERLAKLGIKIKFTLTTINSKLDDLVSDYWKWLYPGDEQHDGEKQEYLDVCLWLPLGFVVNFVSITLLVLGIIISNKLFHLWYYGLIIWLR